MATVRRCSAVRDAQIAAAVSVWVGADGIEPPTTAL
jgi:hypothetical protein